MKSTATLSREECAELFGALSLAAGAEIMRHHALGIAARQKADSSPVTDADEAAEAIILKGLSDGAPGIQVIAEESVAKGLCGAAAGPDFILVDPLDGTREFVAGHEDFTVNIALIRQGVPIAGAVYAPALGRLWIAGKTCFSINVTAGEGMPPRERWRPVHARPGDPENLVALVSRSHLNARSTAELARIGAKEQRSMGSSLKFCVLAEGGADVYPRFGPTMEWDTAAGDAVLRAAGGIVLGEDHKPMRYGLPEREFRNCGFVAWGDPALASRRGAK